MAVTEGKQVLADASRAALFFSELLDSWESLGSIGEEYGERTLMDLM